MGLPCFSPGHIGLYRPGRDIRGHLSPGLDLPVGPTCLPSITSSAQPRSWSEPCPVLGLVGRLADRLSRVYYSNIIFDEYVSINLLDFGTLPALEDRRPPPGTGNYGRQPYHSYEKNLFTPRGPISRVCFPPGTRPTPLQLSPSPWAYDARASPGYHFAAVTAWSDHPSAGAHLVIHPGEGPPPTVVTRGSRPPRAPTGAIPRGAAGGRASEARKPGSIFSMSPILREFRLNRYEER